MLINVFLSRFNRFLDVLPTKHDKVKKEFRIEDRVKVGAVLSFLKGVPISTIADNMFFFHESYFPKIFNQIYKGIKQSFHNPVDFGDPQTLKELNKTFTDRMGRRPYMKRLFNKVIGAVDGYAAKIGYPAKYTNHPEYFKNHKGFYAIILQAVCDGNGKFIFWDLSSGERTHDSTAWKNSSLGKDLADGNALCVGTTKYFVAVG